MEKGRSSVAQSFSLPIELLDRLKEKAKKDKRPLSWLARDAVEEYLDRRTGRRDE